MTLDSRSDELDKKLEDNPVDKGIEALAKGVSRQRRAIRLLAVSIVLEFVLTIGVAVIAFKTNEALNLSQSNKDAVIANCETANDSRKNQLALWNYVFAIPPSQPPTPDQQTRAKEFKSFVDITFQPRDCQKEINK